MDLDENLEKQMFKLRCELHAHSKDPEEAFSDQAVIIENLPEITVNKTKAGKMLLNLQVNSYHQLRCTCSASLLVDLGVLWRTIKVLLNCWINEFSYENVRTIDGFSKFLSCVVFMHGEGSDDQGTVFLASLEQVIRAYDFKNGSLIYELTGHTSQVTCLSIDDSRACLVSGSVDRSVRVWRDKKCISTLIGHEHIVWAVIVINAGEYAQGELPAIISGSADKRVILWVGNKIERTFSGHTDAVRSLVELNETEFLSAANDATVRRWDKHSGDCHMIYYSENYIYSISHRAPYNFFVTGGEDQCIRIWKLNSEGCSQTIKLPAQSAWSVFVLENGDIACGSSDGMIRIFTRNTKRLANEENNLIFEQSVKAFHETVETSDKIGGVNVSDLPGPESLLEAGKRDGQTKMVRSVKDGRTLVELYSWNQEQTQWDKVGDVLGEKKDGSNATDGTYSASGKKIYQGKEYDMIFDVDVEDGKPALKLPYNLNEDPWEAAQRFIHKNFLPQDYLETVANFVTTNAPKNRSSTIAAQVTSDYVDPFTGGGRYVPGSSPGQCSTNSSAVDPLTGGGRYVPGISSAFDPSKIGGLSSLENEFYHRFGFIYFSDPKRPKGDHMPLTKYITFSAVANSMMVKLKENNEQIMDVNYKLSDKQMEEVDYLIKENDCKCSNEIIDLIRKVTKWPNDLIVPGLDAIRLAFLSPSVTNQLFDQKSIALELIDRLCRLMKDKSLSFPFRVLTTRSLTNCLNYESARKILIDYRPVLINLVSQNCLFDAKGHAQIAASAFLANMSLWLFEDEKGEKSQQSTCKNEIFASILDILVKNEQNLPILDKEAIFYLLQALVTFLWGDDSAIDLAKKKNVKNCVVRLKDLTDLESSKIIARSKNRELRISLPKNALSWLIDQQAFVLANKRPTVTDNDHLTACGKIEEAFGLPSGKWLCHVRWKTPFPSHIDDKPYQFDPITEKKLVELKAKNSSRWPFLVKKRPVRMHSCEDAGKRPLEGRRLCLLESFVKYRNFYKKDANIKVDKYEHKRAYCRKL
uniref:Phospholipase A-2-activating protein n=1 Tax=Romanomermis culicivorax TaxID=13658 RepID=A0A915HJQ8_ROMCU